MSLLSIKLTKEKKVGKTKKLIFAVQKKRTAQKKKKHEWKQFNQAQRRNCFGNVESILICFVILLP